VTFESWSERFGQLEQGGLVWKDLVYARLCEEFGIGQSPESLLAEYEDGFARNVVPMPGMRATLARLRAQGWGIGVVTNGRSAFQRRTLSALAIGDLLDVVVVSEECGLRKPDPAIFQLALDALGCQARASWFVGDDPVADVVGARAAGMRALQLVREAATEAEDQVVRIPDVLRRLTHDPTVG